MGQEEVAFCNENVVLEKAKRLLWRDRRRSTVEETGGARAESGVCAAEEGARFDRVDTVRADEVNNTVIAPTGSTVSLSVTLARKLAAGTERGGDAAERRSDRLRAERDAIRRIEPRVATIVQRGGERRCVRESFEAVGHPCDSRGVRSTVVDASSSLEPRMPATSLQRLVRRATTKTN
eukprot:CAMPEP_0197406368 /NCGR_PEP_ID=MMETSP1165-20131217/25694_1 /TAXON_ID=284809 /ORGANISM="Chrysocystis fragilis, Strain CCMP3189" /LENGTH=178 /DNA_ID=CAMNT_0042932717 /DNA_START=218 /DNA_END=755 /DNA_ORIENTATION=-